MRVLSFWKIAAPYAALFWLWLTTGLDTSHAAVNLSAELPDLVERVAPGVVNISSTKFMKYMFYGPMDDVFGQMFGMPREQTQRQSSLGSGFLIDAAGYVLTNNHVIEQADEIVVIFLDKRKIPARVVGRDRAMDLALLQLKGGATNKNLKPLDLGDSEAVRIGEPIFAIGNPFGLQHTVTSGIISAKNRTIGLGAFDRFLQTDASINFGNSGGPLFNFKGEVIGINTAINAQGQGLSFAIPISDARGHIDEFKKYGRIVRPWLGALGENISPALQSYYGIPSDQGVLITQLVVNGPAIGAGLKAGDVIVSVNGTSVADIYDVQRELAKLKPNDNVTIQIRRAKEEWSRLTTKQIKLSATPDADRLPQGIL